MSSNEKNTLDCWRDACVQYWVVARFLGLGDLGAHLEETSAGESLGRVLELLDIEEGEIEGVGSHSDTGGALLELPLVVLDILLCDPVLLGEVALGIDHLEGLNLKAGEEVDGVGGGSVATEAGEDVLVALELLDVEGDVAAAAIGGGDEGGGIGADGDVGLLELLVGEEEA
eukprot:TRINITY_DN14961_c0_g1_i5.p1 TRINITY_DN14961_c0_g1~~TRINITY_DN14961_c0_g1_i5.p1  ORF type:complete len:172 (+),score=30.12 TRINITY_DN14961_c0_g1_i5:909-1424(+)